MDQRSSTVQEEGLTESPKKQYCKRGGTTSNRWDQRSSTVREEGLTESPKKHTVLCLINRVLASLKASSYIVGLVGLYLTVWELAHICQVSVMNSFNSKYDWAYKLDWASCYRINY